MADKNILIINQYCGSPKFGMNFRSWYFAKELKERGHKVRVISASYSHLFHTLPKTKSQFTDEDVEGVDFTWVKVGEYNGSKSIGRVLVMIEFMLKLFFLPKKRLNNPNVILVSSLSPFPILNAFFWSKKYNAKLIFEVRDIWPLTLIEIGGLSPLHPLALFFGWFEKFAYKVSDTVISLLPYAFTHMEDRGMNPKKFKWLSNGVDRNELCNPEQLKPGYFPKELEGKLIVGYAGGIGLANALDYLIETASEFENDSEIAFVLVGKGQEKERLMEKAGSNVFFLDPIPKKMIQSLLVKFDVCYIGWHDEAIYRLGISPNKLFDYMYSAKPIIHSTNARNDLVKEANCGISVEAENNKEIAEAILKLKELNQDERAEMGQRGKTLVLNRFTYAKLTDELETLL